MTASRVMVAASGAVIFGSEMACDGFYAEVPIRVQTHIHDDHMADFNSSKGNQDIVMSRATRDLLIAEFDADLPYRSNVIGADYGVPMSTGGGVLWLLSSAHMLGAAQVLYEFADQYRVGYSGDFSWPIDDVIQVDELVVDSTYGSPDNTRTFTQAEAEARLLDLVAERLRFGPVHIKAHRGTLQRGLQVVAGSVSAPILASPRVCAAMAVYHRHGYVGVDLVDASTEAAKESLRHGRYIQVYGPGDRLPVDPISSSSVNLTAYMSRPNDPLTVYSENSYSVAISNHADFGGTLEYVRATGARYVVTDNSRGGKAHELAASIRDRLGIEAVASMGASTFEWGR